MGRHFQSINKNPSFEYSILQTIAEGVIRVNANSHIDFINAAAIVMFGLKSEDIQSKCLPEIIMLFDDSKAICITQLILRAEAKPPRHDKRYCLYTVKCSSGISIDAELSVSRINDSHGIHRGAVIVFRDVGSRRAKLKQLVWRSNHDPLTGLVNKREMERRISKAILSCRRTGRQSSFLYLDLNRFKSVNDAYGHLAGDQLLKRIAALIKDSLRDRDTFARLGGDEFGILLENCQIVQAERIAHSICESVARFRYDCGDKRLQIGVSVGISAVSDCSSNVLEVLNCADCACYAAKKDKKKSVRVHKSNEIVLKDQHSLINSISHINKALENNAFLLYMQKVLPMVEKNPVHREVFIRMFNDDGKLLQPKHFITTAEDFGLAERIDAWILEHTLNMSSQYLKHGEMDNAFAISINLSASTINDEGYFYLLKKLLKKYKVNPININFEINEAIVTKNFHTVRGFVRKIRRLGCGISIDDYGTDTRSLSYLHQIPVTSIKLNRQIINRLVDDKISRALVEAITRIAHLLSLKVIAKGVEKDEQLEQLREIGVDAVQGFLLERPVLIKQSLANI